jgi:hypothetical protein
MKSEEKKKQFTSYTFPFEEVDRNVNIPRHKKKMYQIKSDSTSYPWPCEDDATRTITVTKDDLFSKLKDGTVIKHTGVGCYGLLIPEEDLVEIF